MDLVWALELGLIAVGAAVIGSMLGLGGGVFMVPIFTLFMGVDQKAAIAASAIAVATNSVVGSNVHLRSRFTNLRLAMLLQIPTAAGAILGAQIGASAPERVVNMVFGAVLLYAATSMMMQRSGAATGRTDVPDPLELEANFVDPATKQEVTYIPTRVKPALGIGLGAGTISGMLGVGGGVILVPAMTLLMRVPVKAAAGTSTFMVGITAVATSFVFYSRGKTDPTIVLPAMAGIFIGSQLGARLTRRLKAQRLVVIFSLVLVYLGVSLVLRALGVQMPWQK